jgi:hypothetical protein
MKRFAVTLASQLLAAIPATAPLIQDAVQAERGLVTGDVSLSMQLDLLILFPFLAVVRDRALEQTLAKGPFLIVIDGLDECEDSRGVQEFIDHMLAFFDEYPAAPLRIFISSRVEQYIRERLETDAVRMENLDSHLPHKDIERFLQAAFKAAAERNRVIRAYVTVYGEWPAKSDMNKLIEYIGGSFVLASTIFRFVVQPATEDDPLTPMERLPLTLNMNGLDGLYAKTLSRSQKFPHYHTIISTIALLQRPLPIVGIADLLDIQTFKVVRVLVNLQAIIHVPGTDEEGEVTLCHTSLRDFLATASRSQSLFVPPSFHLLLSYFSFATLFEKSDGHALFYGEQHFYPHLHLYAFSEGCDKSIDEIDRLLASQSSFVEGLPSHAFFCITFFSLMMAGSSIPASYVLTECTKRLALSVECPDSRVGFWLSNTLYFGVVHGLNRMRTVEFTEQTCESVQQHLLRASKSIHAKVCSFEYHSFCCKLSHS